MRLLLTLLALLVVLWPSAPVRAQAGNTAARANSYDDAWQAAWVANAKTILAGGSGNPGMVIWLGDSLTRDFAMGAWAKNGSGKTASDIMITDWMHASTAPQSITTLDGFALAAPYHCASRSYTVGDSLGAWDFNGTSGMPSDTNPVTAAAKLEDCVTYSNALHIVTILAAIQPAQFSITAVNLFASDPSDLTQFDQMLDTMVAKHIVPIIITYTYRTGAPAFNLLVDEYNDALYAYAEANAYPLIDLQQEMLERVPFVNWDGRMIDDGVHYTDGGGGYTETSDPYADGGDPLTHTTGDALTYNGYGLKGWLGVQKMKEIKELVIDPETAKAPGRLRIFR